MSNVIHGNEKVAGVVRLTLAAAFLSALMTGRMSRTPRRGTMMAFDDRKPKCRYGVTPPPTAWGIGAHGTWPCPNLKSKEEPVGRVEAWVNRKYGHCAVIAETA